MFSNNDDNKNNNNSVFNCNICAHANDCTPVDSVRLFSADDLLKHIHVHLNYRPHQCKKCNFASTSPLGLFEHSQQAEHFHLSFFNARNGFIEEMAQFALDKCMKQQHQHLKGTSDNVPPTNDSERAKLVIDDSAATATPPRLPLLLESCAFKLELEEQMEPIDMDISDGEQQEHVDQEQRQVEQTVHHDETNSRQFDGNTNLTEIRMTYKDRFGKKWRMLVSNVDPNMLDQTARQYSVNLSNQKMK